MLSSVSLLLSCTLLYSFSFASWKMFPKNDKMMMMLMIIGKALHLSCNHRVLILKSFTGMECLDNKQHSANDDDDEWGGNSFKLHS